MVESWYEHVSMLNGRKSAPGELTHLEVQERARKREREWVVISGLASHEKTQVDHCVHPSEADKGPLPET